LVEQRGAEGELQARVRRDGVEGSLGGHIQRI
jgi:hypothetical protein